ncbi:MAG: DUF6316 family protein [Methylobacter sp.]
MFEANRTFSQRNAETGLMEWFFSAREGILGPFHSQKEAEKAIKTFINFNVKNNDDGGRSSRRNLELSLEPLNGSMNTIKFGDTKRKKGIEG